MVKGAIFLRSDTWPSHHQSSKCSINLIYVHGVLGVLILYCIIETFSLTTQSVFLLLLHRTVYESECRTEQHERQVRGDVKKVVVWGGEHFNKGWGWFYLCICVNLSSYIKGLPIYLSFSLPL